MGTLRRSLVKTSCGEDVSPTPWPRSKRHATTYEINDVFAKNQFLWAQCPSWMLPDFLTLVGKLQGIALYEVKRKSRQKN